MDRKNHTPEENTCREKNYELLQMEKAENAVSDDNGYYPKMDRTATQLESDPRPEVYFVERIPG